jgi:TIR domain
VVRCTFSPARAWRPAVVARLARTLGITKTMRHLLEALERVAAGETQLCSPAIGEPEYDSFQAIAEALLTAARQRLVYSAVEERSYSRANYQHILRVLVAGGLTPEGRATLATLRHQEAVLNQLQRTRPPGIFISYRRDDSADIVGRMYDSIIGKIGNGTCFKDVNSIELGRDFRNQLFDALERCDQMLVVIGKNWLSTTGDGTIPRLFEAADYVRIEIATALDRKIPVVPVLVSGGQLPARAALPEDLQDLSYRQSFEVRSDPYFHSDMSILYRGMNLSRSGAE